MWKRSQARTCWPRRHDQPTQRTLRVWICAACRTRGSQLITCADGKQRCPQCKAEFDRRAAAVQVVAPPAPSPIVPAGQLVTPPRVG